MGTANDFDFLQGEWTSRQRRRRKWLAGSDEWDEFEATISARPILDGLGTVEEFRTDYAGGFVGVTFRFFDPASGQWSIYWADTRYPGLLLAPPVIGSFSGEVGVFEADDTHDGRPVRVRYRWSDVNGSTPHWEQAFSEDGGETWETNWTADFMRPRAQRGTTPARAAPAGDRKRGTERVPPGAARGVDT